MEIKHQEYLTEVGVAKVFSPGVQNTVTWIAFYLAVVINIILVLNYTANEGDFDQDDGVDLTDYGGEFETDPTNVSVPDSARTAITILNYLQIIAAAFTIILTVVVVPSLDPTLSAQLGYAMCDSWLKDRSVYKQFSNPSLS